MESVTINTPATNVIEKKAYERDLQILADNLSKENLKFFAELAVKPGINKKIESKKTIIKNFI